jgi:hypothetical protein
MGLFLRVLPRIDTSSVAEEIMSIRSTGRDGAFAGNSYMVGSFDPKSFDEDIVWSDGFFIRWPQVPLERPKFRHQPSPLDSRCTASYADDSSVSVKCSGSCSAEDQTCSDPALGPRDAAGNGQTCKPFLHLQSPSSSKAAQW